MEVKEGCFGRVFSHPNKQNGRQIGPKIRTKMSFHVFDIRPKDKSLQEFT